MQTKRTEPQAHLFNLVEISRGDLPALFVEFYAGDMLSVRSDALIVSSYSGDYYPVAGSVLGTLADRFGIEFGKTRPDGAFSVASNLHRFPTPRCEAFDALWILEVKDTLNRQPISPTDVKKAFTTLKQCVGAILQNGTKSISLPLLGTGHVELPLDDVIAETMSLLKSWTITAPALDTVRVFAYQLESVAKLNRMIDVSLGFPDQPTASALVAAATAELESKLVTFVDPNIRTSLKSIVQLGDVDVPSAKSISLEGRKIAEICSKSLFARLKPGAPVPGKLSGTINELESYIKGTNQTWILHYFRLLQMCGNNAAHPSGVNVNLTDAGAVIVAALRVAEFTESSQP